MNNHGGYRYGSGRKAGPVNMKRNPVTVRLPQWLIEQLDSGNKSEMIENALISHFGLKAPKPSK